MHKKLLHKYCRFMSISGTLLSNRNIKRNFYEVTKLAKLKSSLKKVVRIHEATQDPKFGCDWLRNTGAIKKGGEGRGKVTLWPAGRRQKVLTSFPMPFLLISDYSDGYWRIAG